MKYCQLKEGRLYKMTMHDNSIVCFFVIENKIWYVNNNFQKVNELVYLTKNGIEISHVHEDTFCGLKCEEIL